MEMKPIYEIQIKDKFSVAHFYSMAKRSGKEDRKIQNWFGQVNIGFCGLKQIPALTSFKNLGISV